MKIRQSIGVLFIVMMCFAYGCKKEKGLLENGPIECSSFALGDTNCFSVSSISQLIQGSYNHSESDSFDIDSDGDFDIMFLSSRLGSPGSGIRDIAEVSCLSSGTELATIQYSDTVFVNISYDTIAEPISVLERTTNTCERRSHDDSIASVGFRYLLDTTLHSESEIFSITNWYSETIRFAGSLYGMNPYQIDQQNDTAYYVQHLRYTDCHNLQDNETFYLALKTIDNQTNSVRYGWVSFHVFEEIEFWVHDMAIYDDRL